MDGVPHLVSEPVAPGRRFTFAFVVPDPDTHWFHPHSGVSPMAGMDVDLLADHPGPLDDPLPQRFMRMLAG